MNNAIKPSNICVLVMSVNVGLRLTPNPTYITAMIVVANTTPIISLACVGRLDLLERLFGKVIILLNAKEKGHITQIKPLLDEMINKGRWYSNGVYRAY